MKKRAIIFYILLISVCQNSDGQTNAKSISIPLENHNVIDVLKVTSDLYFIRSTATNDLPFYKDPILSAWNSKGEFLWSRDFILNSNIVSNQDGTFTTFSNKKSEKTACSNLMSKYDLDIQMIKFDSTGIIKFDTIYKFDCTQTVGPIVKTDSGIIMHPNYYDSFMFDMTKVINNNNRNFNVQINNYSVVKFTDEGNIEWATTIQNWWSKGYPFIEVKKDNFNMHLPLGKIPKRIESIQFSRDGNIQKKEEYKIENWLFPKIEKILPLKEHSYLVLGVEELECCQNVGTLVCIENGTTKWTEKFEGRPMEMLKTMDNNFVVLCHIYDPNAKEIYSTILKFDIEGHLLQEYIFKEEESFIYSSSILEDKENEFIIVGSKIQDINLSKKRSIFFKRIILD